LLAAAAKKSPDDGEIESDLAASYGNLAALLAETDPARAIELHQMAVDQFAHIAERHPAEPNAKSRWALALNNLGAAQARAGELSQAVASYRRAIELEKQLVRVAPLARGSRRDLAVSYNNLGLALARLHQSDGAVTAFRNALGFQEQLVAENPSDIEILSSLAGVCNNLGIVLEESGHAEEAAASYQQAVDRQGAAHARAATVDRYREHLSKHYYNLGRALRKLGRADEAARAALARKQLWQHDPQRLLSIAEELALASKQLKEHARGELSADRCADLSMAALAEAVAAGLQIPPDLERNESFAALRGRADFAALVHP
jgi:tetratricopeptide (TPR) repeat protein